MDQDDIENLQKENAGQPASDLQAGAAFCPWITAAQARQFNPLVLAYVGDAVQDLSVRTHLATHRRGSAHDLHVEAIAQVCASAQAGALHRILDKLTEEEQDIYRRGRNAKSPTIPKNANVGEYRVATGLEAVLGYLYLTGNTARLSEVLGMMMEGI